MFYSTYTSPNAIARQLDKADYANIPTSAGDEYTDYFALIGDYCKQASDYMTNETGRAFVPYLQTYTLSLFDLLHRKILRRNKLRLPTDLLSMHSLTIAGQTIDPTLYSVDSADMWGSLPYEFLRLDSSLAFYGLDFDTTLTITGIWGYHTNLVQAYTPIETIMGTLSISATTITVADATAYDLLTYLRIESEWVQVIDRDEDANTITVSRSVNGSTAVAHTNYLIERFNVVADLALATTRLVSYLYQRRNDASGRAQFADGTVVFDDMPVLVKETVKQYRRLVWEVA